MTKRFPLMLIIMGLMSSFVIGQPHNVDRKVDHKSAKVDFNKENPDQNASFYMDYKNRQLQSQQKTNAVPMDFVIAAWDWPCNSYQAPLSFVYDFTGDGVVDPVMVATEGASDLGIERQGLFGYIDDFGATSYNIYPGIDPGTGNPWRTGWNSHLFMDYSTGKVYIAIYDFLNSSGNINDKVWVVDLLDDPSTATELTDSLDALEGGWPRFARDGNGMFWELLDNYAAFPQNIALSDDGAATFAVVDSVGSGDPTFWYNDYGNDPVILANGDKLSVVTALVKGGGLDELGIYGGADVTDPDSASGFYNWYSTDGGANWMGEMIFYDGDTSITNRRNYSPNLANWDFACQYIDNNGVTHVTTGGGRPNSYGIVGSDTINVAGIYYWNDRDKNWMSIEIEDVETYPYDSDLCSNNSQGPYEPSVMTDPSGQLVVAMWHRPQFSGDPGNSTINIYDNPPDVQVYFYDIVYAYSEDGGVTWSTPEIAVSVPDETSTFPSISGIEVGAGEAKVHFIYYYDAIPGSAVLGTNPYSTQSVWRYDTIEFSTVLSVGNEIGTVSDFQLEQNYPNPFNPSTTINYTLPERSAITLKVYDVLGNEVATLVNTTQEAGKYDVTFDASKFASGLYIYTLNAGDFTSSRKMMLLK
jgi:hypothetical protein